MNDLRETPYRKAGTVATDLPPRSNLMWVVVDRVRQHKAEWTYILSDTKPDPPEYRAIRGHQILSDRVYSSYSELCAWLTTFGCKLPPPDYFTPTAEEQAEGAERIVRLVARTN